MRPILKTVLFACALCAVAPGQRAARAQPDPGNPPSPSPAQPLPPAPPPAADPTPTVDPNAPPPAPINDPAVTAPSSTTTTTTTTTTTDTTVAPVITDTDDSFNDTWHDSSLQTGIGVSTILGGGVAGFTDRTMRDTTSSVGGLWGVRMTIGSHIPLGVDLAYVGSAMNLNGLPGGQSGTLIGTTAEAALRYNIMAHMPFNPYVFAGIGWQRYDVTSAHVTLSDAGMNETDNLLEFPLGLGFSYRKDGFVGDLRGTFRATTDQNLVLKNGLLPPFNPTSNDFAPMHTWEASAALGYEF